jgi:hypothetical protein
MAAYALAWHGIVLRHSTPLSDSPYAAELCSARTEPEYPEPPHEWSDPAPGGNYKGNRQGRYLALSREAPRHYDTIFVWDEGEHSLTGVVSIQEADPGSGRSHHYRWSHDGKALLIHGRGSVPFQSRPAELFYAYLPDEDALYELPACQAEGRP